MGDSGIHAAADEQVHTGVDSYKILVFGPTERVPDQYHSLIYSKWMRSYRYGNDYIKLADSDSYYATYIRHITRVLSDSQTVVRLAVLSDDKDVVLGFSVSRGTILDYVHVHKDMRRIGIGTKLIPPGIEWFTHLTRTAMTIWGSKYKDWKLNLFA